MADQVSIVCARKPTPAERRAHIGGPLVLVAIAVFEAFDGVWWVAIASAVGALLLVPVAYIWAARSATRHPDWIEVRSDRITGLRATGTSLELLRNPDSVLRVRDDGSRPVLHLDGTTSTGTIPLARFDVEEVRRITEASGWHWIAPDSTFPAPPRPIPTSPPSEDETRIQVRDGSTTPIRSSPQTVAVLVVCVAIVATGAAVGGVPSNDVLIAVGGAGAVIGFLLVARSLQASRRLAISLSIRPDRVTVTYGRLISQVVQRTAIASATTGSQYLRLRSPSGKALISIPLNPHRAAILKTLADNGWPTTSSSGRRSTPPITHEPD
ncbi:hypothetical protein [Kribbella sp. VKM Ac-2566]|uniref:hypothetical protein n=1 Tax=Kribbella sp. VKM Ac-2566 TaxID=2512218 RepID=UPI001063690F|nr:hypothetical protein [Kribbella sp. VKM Ac-2566]TDX08399.1 hypothetical protein EV647_0320 [Kribbella sp. VKM Ac-2566]